MLCILHMENGEIAGWLIATDVDDARRQVSDQDLASELCCMTFTPPPGKHELLGGKYLMLVQ